MKNLLTIFFAICFFSSCAFAQEQAEIEHVRARILSAGNGTAAPGGASMLLDIDLDDGWYTYWRMGGDTGLPPRFDWSQSENVAQVTVAWPAPKRFTVMDMHSFGYDDKVAFPLTIKPAEPGKALKLVLNIDMMICHDICIPASLLLTKDEPAKPSPQKADAARIEAARKTLAHTSNSDDLGMNTAVLGKDAIVVTAYAKGGWLPAADVFVEAEDVLITGMPDIIIDASDPAAAVIKIKAPPGVDFSKALFGKSATVTLVNGAEAVERRFSF